MAIIVSMALVFLTALTSYAQSPQAPNVVTIEAPTQVNVGEVITLRLRVKNAPVPAGFEAYIAFDRSVAEYAGFTPAPAAAGTSRDQLIVPEVANGAIVGTYTCATEACLSRRQPAASAAASPDFLGEVELLPLAPGRLHIELAHLKLVDSSGQPLAFELPQRTLTVQVGEEQQEYPANASVWNWQSASSASIASVAAADVAYDGRVTHSDVMEVALAWTSAREAGAPCSTDSARDINGDGCVDIGDVQAVAAFAQGAQVSTAKVEQTATIITVTSDLDEFDTNLDDGVCRTLSNVCTLRAAIAEANVQEGDNIINFAIPGEGVHTIQLDDRLPTIWDTTGSIRINGYSQPGATVNTDSLISNAQIKIEIRGDGSEAFDGLAITSGGNIIQGLAFYNLKRSLWIYGSGAVGNQIIGNFVGTDVTGTFAAPAVSENQAHGIHVEQGSIANQIGGIAPAERNVISGNARHGVGFWHVGTDENLVYNNIVGLSPDGTRRIPNRQQGVDMNFGASYNIIGGVEAGQRNVISGNGENGAEITHGVETTRNTIRGNYIGTDVTGESASAFTSNGGLGVSLHDRIRDNLVTENVIGNNRAGGLQVDNFGTCCIRDNRIELNWIGVTPGGVNIANGVFGVRLLAPESVVGPGNHIAYNPIGIVVEDDESIGNTITQNSIYNNGGLGIDIAPVGQINLNDADDADSGPNVMLNFPVLQSLTPEQILGTACANCTVEIFIADQKTLGYGEGKTYVATTLADATGHFTAAVTDVDFGDFLTATATDIQGNTSEFSRNALIPNPANSPPLAVDDAVTTTQGTAVVIDVLANDTDPEDDTLTVVDLGNAANGTLATDGTTITYTPTVDFVGTEIFTYGASDTIGGSSVATVTVTVEEGIVVTPGVNISPTTISLTIGGPPVSYTIWLESEPTAPVTISLNVEAPLVATPTQLVFNSDNWEIPQSITLSVDDSLTASDATAAATVIQTSTVRHTITSSDSNYSEMGAPTLTVDIIEQPWNGVYMPFIERE